MVLPRLLHAADLGVAVDQWALAVVHYFLLYCLCVQCLPPGSMHVGHCGMMVVGGPLGVLPADNMNE
jgi:hypothetical protein